MDMRQYPKNRKTHGEFLEKSIEVMHWLTDFSIDSKEKIVNIKECISGKISDMKNSHGKSTVGMDKWLQGLALSIVLAIVTTDIAGVDATEKM